jgi:proteic killer suppression protein
MIRNFYDKATEHIFHNKNTKAARHLLPRELWKTAVRELDQLNAAAQLMDLSAPPGNQLEALKGDLEDSYSIRINEQYRVTFRFQNGTAADVRITDYH